MLYKSNMLRVLSLFIVVIINFMSAMIFHNSVVLVISMFLLFWYCIIKSDYSTLFMFMICTVSQNIVLIVSSGIMDGSETTAIILLKELIAYVCALLYFVRKRILNYKVIDILTTVFCCYSILNLLIFSPDFGTGFAGLRQLLIVFLCFYFGMSIRKMDYDGIDKFFRSIIAVATVISLIGFVLLFFPVELWENIGYGEYWYNKTGNMHYDLSGFYTYDVGFRVRRMVSVFAEPLAFAHFNGIAFVILFTRYKGKSHIFSKIVITLSLLLGLSKASVLLIVCVILVVNYSKIRNKHIRRLFVMFMCMGGVGALLFLSKYTSSLQQATSIGNHINSLIYGLSNMTIWGNGYGTLGYNALIMGGDVIEEGLESFFSTCVGQVGIVGVTLIYSFMIYISVKLIGCYMKCKNNIVLVAAVLLVSVVLESLLSASAVSMLGTGLYFCIAGLAYKNIEMEN